MIIGVCPVTQLRTFVLKIERKYNNVEIVFINTGRDHNVEIVFINTVRDHNVEIVFINTVRDWS